MKSILLAFVYFLAAPLALHAAVLGTATVGTGVGFPIFLEHRFRLVLSFGKHTELLFEDVHLDSTSVGAMLTADASSDTDFVAVAAIMTNGTAELFCVSLFMPPGGGGSCLTEEVAFKLSEPDFRGDQVNAITLHVDSLSFVEPNIIGGTSASATVTLQVLGVAGGVPAAEETWGRVKARYR